MNRQLRRMMQARAEELARDLARTCFDYTADGRLVPVRDARAVKVLEAAFASMLRQGGEPAVLQITDEAARAFPRKYDPASGVAHMIKPWLAVGLDQAGQATYALRHLLITGMTPAEERDLAEIAMLGELAQELNVPGFPAGQSAGRA